MVEKRSREKKSKPVLCRPKANPEDIQLAGDDLRSISFHGRVVDGANSTFSNRSAAIPLGDPRATMELSVRAIARNPQTFESLR